MVGNEFTIHVSKEQIAQMPTVSYPGHITVIDTVPLAIKAIAYLKEQPVVGFDTETRPSFRKGHVNSVALIQIATADRCFLFRVNHLGIFQELKDFLEDGNVTKIGLSLRDDFHVLHRIQEFTPGGFVDLQEFVKNYNITDCSLQKIYGILFNQRISKSQRLSNWEADTLTAQQQMYASIDAWACLRIYQYLLAGNFDPAQSEFRVPEEPA